MSLTKNASTGSTKRGAHVVATMTTKYLDLGKSIENVGEQDAEENICA
jgi:hypothetical protein